MDDTNTDIVITGDGVANFTPGSQTNGSAPHSTVKLRPLSATERSRRHRQRKRDAAATRPATDASVAGPVTSRVAPAIAMQRTLGAVIAVVGIGLSIAGMFASTRYAIMTTTGADRILAAGVAVAADLLTLTLPSGTIAIWRAKRRGLALASVLLWLAAAAITTTNLSGFFGAKADIFMSGRETATTARTLVLERVARLRDERDTISEFPPGRRHHRCHPQRNEGNGGSRARGAGDSETQGRSRRPTGDDRTNHRGVAGGERDRSGERNDVRHHRSRYRRCHRR